MSNPIDDFNQNRHSRRRFLRFGATAAVIGLASVSAGLDRVLAQDESEGGDSNGGDGTSGSGSGGGASGGDTSGGSVNGGSNTGGSGASGNGGSGTGGAGTGGSGGTAAAGGGTGGSGGSGGTGADGGSAQSGSAQGGSGGSASAGGSGSNTAVPGSGGGATGRSHEFRQLRRWWHWRERGRWCERFLYCERWRWHEWHRYRWVELGWKQRWFLNEQRRKFVQRRWRFGYNSGQLGRTRCVLVGNPALVVTRIDGLRCLTGWLSHPVFVRFLRLR